MSTMTLHVSDTTALLLSNTAESSSPPEQIRKVFDRQQARGYFHIELQIHSLGMLRVTSRIKKISIHV